MAKGQPSFTYQEENSATFMQKQPSFEENANEIKNSQPMFINVEWYLKEDDSFKKYVEEI